LDARLRCGIQARSVRAACGAGGGVFILLCGLLLPAAGVLELAVHDLEVCGRRFELKRELAVRFLVLRSLMLEKMRSVFEKWLGLAQSNPSADRSYGQDQPVTWPRSWPGFVGKDVYLSNNY
jgi:hypothetical protein